MCVDFVDISNFYAGRMTSSFDLQMSVCAYYLERLFSQPGEVSAAYWPDFQHVLVSQHVEAGLCV
jgi:hypothetical protein